MQLICTHSCVAFGSEPKPNTDMKYKIARLPAIPRRRNCCDGSGCSSCTDS